MSSPFFEILREMVERVPGALGAIFADWEGEAVDHFAHLPPLEIQLIGAHWGIVLTQVGDAIRRSGAGEVTELLFECEQATVLVHRVTDRYFVVMQAGHNLHLATALREIERSARTLRAEM